MKQIVFVFIFILFAGDAYMQEEQGLNKENAQVTTVKSAQWIDGKSYPLKGLKVHLSMPVRVAKNESFLWFPKLILLSDGRLLAVMSHYADIITNTPSLLASWSENGGLTWTDPQPSLYAECAFSLPNGDHLLLPYILYRQSDNDMKAPYQICPKGKKELKVVEGVTVTGWPKPYKMLDPRSNACGFVFYGDTLKAKDNVFLTTLYGTFEGDKRYCVVMVESADGVHWKFRSVVADGTCRLEGSEGPCEPTVCRLKDGRLMGIYRMGSPKSYGQSFSGDDGRTWTEPVGMPNACTHAPCVRIMKDGLVILSCGGPGMELWFNLAGDGKAWQTVPLWSHHNNCLPQQGIKLSSVYTQLAVLDDTHLLCIYDSINHGHEPDIKKIDPNGGDSVWVVRITIER